MGTKNRWRCFEYRDAVPFIFLSTYKSQLMKTVFTWWSLKPSAGFYCNIYKVNYSTSFFWQLAFLSLLNYAAMHIRWPQDVGDDLGYSAACLQSGCKHILGRRVIVYSIAEHTKTAWRVCRESQGCWRTDRRSRPPLPRTSASLSLDRTPLRLVGPSSHHHWQ